MGLAVWRDISLIWLILWTLLAVLPVGVLLFFAIKGLHHLRPMTRKALRSVQSRIWQVGNVADRLSQKATAPVVRLRARAAQVDRLRRAAFRR
jgi:hypothetical protein